MVHFDSHPDLTFPTQLKADEVFDKIKLMDTVGIADWILPAMYAGHISRVVWIKPPWSDQIENKRIKFKIGKHKRTGDVKVTSTECYFLHDLLYSPEEKLTHCRDVELIIMTLSCVELDGSHTSCVAQGEASHHRTTSSEHYPSRWESTKDKNTMDKRGVGLSTSEGLQCSLSLRDEENKSGNLENKTCQQIAEYSTLNTVCSCYESSEQWYSNSYGSCKRTKVSHDTEEKEFSGSYKHTCPGETRQSHSSTCSTHNTPSTSNRGDVQSRDDKIQRHTNSDTESSTTVEEVVQLLNETLEPGMKFILDIDMDFFSVLNPFKQDYTKEEFESLASLYTLPKPKSVGKEDIDSCVEECRQKLEEFQETLGHLEREAVDSDVQSLQFKFKDERTGPLNPELVSLVEGLCKRKPETPLDYELLHHAGLTCELPIHVSSDQEIDGLMQSIQCVLSRAPTPTIITMARSAEDEYTPPFQVERIQESLLNVLHTVYSDKIGIKVYRDYERNVGNPQVSWTS